MDLARVRDVASRRQRALGGALALVVA